MSEPLEQTVKLSEEELAEQGRAIARGIAEENARKEKNQAKEAKRMKTMIRNAAEKFF